MTGRVRRSAATKTVGRRIRARRRPCGRGVGPALEDERDQPGGARADPCSRALDPLDGPLGVPPVRARHVLRHGRVPAAADTAQMGGNALALVEDLDRACGQPRLDLVADQAIGDRVVVAVDVDMVVEADPPQARPLPRTRPPSAEATACTSLRVRRVARSSRAVTASRSPRRRCSWRPPASRRTLGPRAPRRSGCRQSRPSIWCSS